MVTQLKGSLYYLFSSLRFSLLVFWSILGGVLVISFITDLLMTNSRFSFNLSFPTYIFAAIFGFWMIKNVIPFLIKMGATRKAIFLSIGIFGIVLSVLNAMLSNTASKIIAVLYSTNSLNHSITLTVDGNEQFFNHIGDFLGDNSWLTRVVIDSSISFFFFGCLFVGGLIFYKYGVVGGMIFFALGFIAMIYAGHAGVLETFVKAIFTNFSIVFFYQLFAVGIVVYLLSFLFIRRLTI